MLSELPRQLLAVCVGRPQSIAYNGRQVSTAIFKQPVQGKVMCRALGLNGDAQADLTMHGGVEKAIYAYPVEHYAYWERELARGDLPLGQFGENFILRGLAEDRVRLGDVFRVGHARVQVTQPRVSCYKIGLRLNAGPGFPKRFLESGRLGYYFRVLEEGEVEAGDAVELEDSDARSITIAEFIEFSQSRLDESSGIRRILESRALPKSWRAHFEERLDGHDRRDRQA